MRVRIALIAALSACTHEAEPVEEVDRYAEPERFEGPSYADCTYAYGPDGTVWESGDYDREGHLVQQRDCYDASGTPIRERHRAYRDGELETTWTQFLWGEDWDLHDGTTYSWEGGLLVRAQSWDEISVDAFRYDGQLRTERRRTEDGEVSTEVWTWSEDGRVAYVEGDVALEHTWDAHDRLISTTAWDDESIEETRYVWEDGHLVQTQTPAGLTEFVYGARGRVEERWVDGELVGTWTWDCP